ncbi:helix-turn-helix domain-containing protein (plasmid) [Streptomyces sp. NBC_01298]|uniref:helix-turn-helix domain-containing protein n=1 Tax=Streptomyces sp. NBC_01298 TaxID=2903817 RepID=UPI002E12CFF9|nr:helix-turn-helix domain-containing protein [Streptomyces sp. NBC_01298]
MNAGTKTGAPAVDDDLAAEMRAQRLRNLIVGRREFLNLRQEEVADRLEMSARNYGNWERGVVKEWTDDKLFQLAEALEMTEFQTVRLFLIAVDRLPDTRPIGGRGCVEGPSLDAFLYDYAAMMEALSLPTFLIDHRWEIKSANAAYRELFRGMGHHPSAMPSSNFLRFGLFHPDAPAILVDYRNWQLSMLAQLATSLERYDQDINLRRLRRDVHLDPALREAYLDDMQTWVLGAGADLVHHEGTARIIRHPDPVIGLQSCRLVEETPRALQARGLARITLVLTELDTEGAAELMGPRHAPCGV